MAATLRIGLIGLDTSHVVAFSELLNGPKPMHATARVTCAFAGGCRDWDLSWSRIPGFTEKVKALGVAILDSPEAVSQASDLIFITEVDGRMHRDLLQRVAPVHKPVFVDKPFALTMEDAQHMLALAQKQDFALMSCSSLRYAESLVNALADDSGGAITGLDVFGPMALLDPAPGLFWYGVHAVEMVVRIMGLGCSDVRVTRSANSEVFTFTWPDGRMATYRGQREAHSGIGAVIHRQKAFQMVDTAAGGTPYYASLLQAILRSLPHGRSDVPAQEMLEVVRLMVVGNQARLAPQAVSASA